MTLTRMRSSFTPSRNNAFHRLVGVLTAVLTLSAPLLLLGPAVQPASAATFGSVPHRATLVATTPTSAYRLVASDGGVFTFGGATYYGSMGGQRLNKPIVGMVGSAAGGYWLVASDGGIFSFGPGATFYGSTGGLRLARPVVGMTATPSGNGYWLVASDGGIFAFGDAAFYGSMGAVHLNQPVVGMASTPSGNGYWLVASDGGIFAFGDAAFYGSTGNLNLNEPIVGMAADSSGTGYWFTSADGGVFAFGDAKFYGSLGSTPQSRPIVSITATPDGQGYWFTNNNGAITPYGDAAYWGSAPQVLTKPIVGMAEAPGNGSFTASSYPSGSYGYDISNYQSGNYPPTPHTIGVVQVAGASFGANPYLASEAMWAGGGLNLYDYVTFGTTGSVLDGACAATSSPSACNFGFSAAIDSFQKASAAGVDTSVPWWLDVESDPSWSSNLAANAALVQGAIDGLHFEGLNSVGIYASPGQWTSIVGNWSPAVPYWAADWGINPATTCSNVKSLYSYLPSGPVELVQYSSSTYDQDYAC